MEGLGEAFSVVGKNLLEIHKKDVHPEKTNSSIFHSSSFPNIHYFYYIYDPEEKNNSKKTSISLPKRRS